MIQFKQYPDREQMAEQGWRFPSEPELVLCKRCGDPILWCKSPTGKNTPLNGATSTIVHFDTCGKSAPRPSPPARPAPASAPKPAPARPATSPASQASTAGAAQLPPPSPAALVEALREHAGALRELTRAIYEQIAAGVPR